MMLPSGDPTETQLKELAVMLSPGDVVIDGGNSNYKDSQRRGAWLAELGIEFMDAGTSGGVWGLDNGYCLMVGGSKEVAAIMQPVLQALAPAPDRGWAHVGPVGAGHYSKMGAPQGLAVWVGWAVRQHCVHRGKGAARRQAGWCKGQHGLTVKKGQWQGAMEQDARAFAHWPA